MKCKRCNNEIKENWSFCPVCGTPKSDIEAMPIKFNFSEGPLKFNFTEGMDFDEDFEEVFSEAVKEVDKILKTMGFPGSMNITVKTNRPVQTTNKPLRITNKPVRIINRQLQAQARPQASVKKQIRHIEQPQRIVKTAEEPETKMQTAGNTLSIEVKVPGVTSLRDILIKKLKESIEIRAYAGDKLYFKVIPIAETADVVEKKFVNGILALEIQK